MSSPYEAAAAEVRYTNTRDIRSCLYEDIFQFDVPVKDVFRVKLHGGFNQLPHYDLAQKDRSHTGIQVSEWTAERPPKTFH